MTDDELRGMLPKVVSRQCGDEVIALYHEADYLYGRCVYGCECLEGYYAIRRNMDPEAGKKLAEANELHYAGLVTVSTALCGEAMAAVSVLYDGPEYQDGGIMDVMDKVTNLSPTLSLMIKGRGGDPGPKDPAGEGFEGPAGEMAKRAVGVSAVVDRHKQLDPEHMLGAENLQESYMVLWGMLQSGCEIMRYAVKAITGEDLPPVKKREETGAALVMGPLAASLSKLADKM